MRILLIVAVALVVYFLLRKKKVASVPSESSKKVDRWLLDALPGALDAHLKATGVDRDQVARALGGDPDPQVVTALEQHVRGVEIEYLRDPHQNGPAGVTVDVCARIRFEDGSEEAVRTRLPFGELPEAVRADLERNATQRTFRAWHFPWVQSW